jgi:hypothetical protein
MICTITRVAVAVHAHWSRFLLHFFEFDQLSISLLAGEGGSRD